MKLNVLISIHPKYVQEIVNGNKKYEYRKSMFKKDIDKVYIYSTMPEQKIIGYFKFDGYIKETPQKVWETTKEFSGIDEDSYYKYFNEKPYAYAIKIKQIYLFNPPVDPKKVIQNFIPPQLYMYVRGELYSK